MFYISEIKRMYEAVKADSGIEESDKQKVAELVKQLIDILVQY